MNSMSMSSTSSTSSGMSTPSGMSHGSDHGAANSTVAGGDQSTMMGMSTMMMTFFTSISTPLYSEAWMPSSVGQYAGTCIFLIILAALFRALVAVRCNFTALSAGYRHRHEPGWLSVKPREEGKARKSLTRRWTIEEAIPLAILDTALAGVSYLLMLAVMTMNIGYFLSILGGTFLSSLGFGHWVGPLAH